MRIAALGDIHGNLFALQAVLADLRTQRPDALVITGDLVYKFPWGAEVVDLVRSLPHQSIMGNSELYLMLWETPLWPRAAWDMPLAQEVIAWERDRLGAERMVWLAALPEHATFSGGRLEDLLVVHGVPGNPFLPLLPQPGQDRPPWVQTDGRIRSLLAGVDADVVVCGHTHTAFQRRIRCPGGQGSDREIAVVNPGALGYGRGRDAEPGRASYALLDWTAPAGWQVTFRAVRYDLLQLHAGLLTFRGDYPIAAFMANRTRPPGAEKLPEARLDFLRYRWGHAPDWWDARDQLADWQALRRDGCPS